MLGAIAGDIIGSPYEFNNIKSTDFPLFRGESRFTDDTVLTVATADSLLNNLSFSRAYREYYRRYPEAGYGGSFNKWAQSDSQEPYGSWGNGSAMRVSPIGFFYNSEKEVLEEAKKSALATHNHPEGVKGAQAVALAIYLARIGASKDHIIEQITSRFYYDISESIASVRSWYEFDVSCQGSVPQALRAFYESDSFEDAIRKAVSIGGDSDTIACITGGIAEAFYGQVPDFIEEEVYKILNKNLAAVVKEFQRKLKEEYTGVEKHVK